MRAMRRLATLSVLAPVALMLACSSASICSEIVTTSETSSGTYAYSLTGAGGGASRGDLGPSTQLSVIGAASSSETSTLSCDYGPPLPTIPNDAQAFIVIGSFLDSMGDTQTFCLQIVGASAGGTLALASGSVACLSFLPGCTPLTGTLDASSFSSECSGKQGCALTLEGTLDAKTSWPGNWSTSTAGGGISTVSDPVAAGTFAVNLNLGHQDACE